MPHPLLLSSQSDYLIWVFDRNSHISSEANWSGSTLFANTRHVVFSKRRVKFLTVWFGSQVSWESCFFCFSDLYNTLKRSFLCTDSIKLYFLVFDLFCTSKESLLWNILRCPNIRLYVYSRTSMARTPMAVYHGLFKFIFVSIRNFSDSSRKQIEWSFLILLWNCMLCVLIRIASLRWVHATYHYFVEDRKHFHKYRHLVPDLTPWLNLTGSNYPSLEQISMVPKMFEPFDCIIFQLYILETWVHWEGPGETCDASSHLMGPQQYIPFHRCHTVSHQTSSDQHPK